MATKIDYSLLEEIHDGTDRWQILVRVFRKWNVYHKASPTDLFCVSMVFVDEKGSTIQASAINKNLHQQFRHEIKEGETIFVANFVVSPNVNQYRASTHPFKITITTSTYIEHKVAKHIPGYSYSFIPIPDILKATDETHVDNLIDILAFVKTMGPLEEYYRDNITKNRLRMTLTDIEGNDVDCVLYDDCASDAYMSQMQNTDNPVIILLSLARIGFTDDGPPYISNSFSATRVTFNQQIKEVKDLIASAMEKDSSVISTYSQSIHTQSSQSSASSSFQGMNRISISEINVQEIGHSFIINAEIVKLETRYGWNYDGCKKCSSKPTMKNNVLVCHTCKKEPQSIESKLRIHYMVKDDSGTASVIFWDKLATQLIQKTAPELKLLLSQTQKPFEFPKELDNPVGKKMLIQMKLNDYNKKHPSASISVVQYIICEDLMNQFSEPNVEGNDGVNDIEEVVEVLELENSNIENDKKPLKKKKLSKLNPTEEDEDDDMTVFQLSRQTKSSSTRGKRQITKKKDVVIEDGPHCSEVACHEVAVGRKRKVIKKEK